jgi:hypothetical protein
VYPDSTTASDGYPENITGKKGFFFSGIVNTHSSYSLIQSSEQRWLQK